MTVYVDDMGLQATVQNGAHQVSGKWCHLFADTHDELMEVARAAGLNPKWVQHPGTPDEHFDVTGRRVAAVVRAGAQPVSWRFTGQFFAERNDRARGTRTDLERCGDIGCTDHPGDDPDVPRWSRMLLVTGPREVTDEAAVAEKLRPEFSPGVVLLTGGARGVDTISARLWRQWGGDVEQDRVTPEEWNRNRAAGFERNNHMVAKVRARGGRVLALEAPCTKASCPREEPHNTHGTSQCAEAAERAGLDVSRQPVVADPAAQRAPGPAEPRQGPDGRQRHSWGQARDGVRTCERDGCGMAAEQRRNPATNRPLVIYSKDGQRAVSERVPPCGSQLAPAISADERHHLAAAADRQAGAAFRAGDLDRAFRLVTDARCLDPDRSGTWDQRESQIRARAGQRQPEQQRDERADRTVIEAEMQQWAHWNAGLPKGLCGPEWRQCPEHGTAAVRARLREAREREGSA